MKWDIVNECMLEFIDQRGINPELLSKEYNDWLHFYFSNIPEEVGRSAFAALTFNWSYKSLPAKKDFALAVQTARQRKETQGYIERLGQGTEKRQELSQKEREEAVAECRRIRERMGWFV